MTTKEPILVAEDDENDVYLLKWAAERAGILNPLQFVRTGDEAVEYVAGQGVYANREVYPLPAIILLDINMPRRTGIEVLRWMRSHPESASLVVILFSSSLSPQDFRAAYQAGANSCLMKPGSPNELAALLRLIRQYWLDTNVLPPPYQPA